MARVTSSGKRVVVLSVPEEAHRQLRIAAAEQDVSVSEVVLARLGLSGKPAAGSAVAAKKRPKVEVVPDVVPSLDTSGDSVATKQPPFPAGPVRRRGRPKRDNLIPT